RQGMWQRVLPLAASIMGVAVVGWIALQGNHDDAAAPPLRVAAPPQASTIAARAVARSTDAGAEALRAYVFAHQSTAQQGAMPGVAPYVRTVAEVARGPQQ
ncbi:MAG: anti-sigma 24 factor, partial [Rhodocyclaceae bacterium]|nr:anti-sigma 24 factor [Rhodocyclaceae bacterium]